MHVGLVPKLASMVQGKSGGANLARGLASKVSEQASKEAFQKDFSDHAQRLPFALLHMQEELPTSTIAHFASTIADAISTTVHDALLSLLAAWNQNCCASRQLNCAHG